jgi:TPR repeat protein
VIALAGVVLIAGPANADAAAGEAAYHRGDYPVALRELQPASQAGDPTAQELLATMYEHGWGVPHDDAKALALFRQAADRSAEAQGNLGTMYMMGRGVPRDPVAARAWFEKSAAGDAPVGEFNLGSLYENGWAGLPVDHHRAFELYLEAAGHGMAEAQAVVAGYYEAGAVVPLDDQQAINWLRKAAAQGVAEPQYRLASHFFGGRGADITQDEAVKWLLMAADQDYPDAVNNLGAMYVTGHAVPQDPGKAAQLFRRAARKGLAGALFNLGRAYDEGVGVAQDHQLACDLFAIAAARGDGRGRERCEALNAQRSVEQQAHARARAAAWSPGSPLPGD